jgi:hypothetical protein
MTEATQSTRAARTRGCRTIAERREAWAPSSEVARLTAAMAELREAVPAHDRAAEGR